MNRERIAVKFIPGGLAGAMTAYGIFNWQSAEPASSFALLGTAYALLLASEAIDIDD